jgi:hypothetical protein
MWSVAGAGENNRSLFGRPVNQQSAESRTSAVAAGR